MKQRIDGDGNVQIGRVDGDLQVIQAEPLDPHNPNLVECPSCWKIASRYARACPFCGYDIAGHFEAIARKAERERLNVVAIMSVATFFGVGLVLSFAWVPESFKGPLAILALLSLMLAAGSLSRADKLR